jgi:hypothetical protein
MNRDEPAFAQTYERRNMYGDSAGTEVSGGLTKREYAAVQIMAAWASVDADPKACVKRAVWCANALFDELDKEGAK